MMLLILVLLCWAKKPMHFSRRWKNALVVAAILTAACLPGGLLDCVSMRSRSFAEEASSVNRTPPSTSTAPRSPGLSSGKNLPASPLGRTSDVDKRIREGTLVPPITGRIAMVGRRWGFIPDAAAKNHSGTSANSSAGKTAPTHEAGRSSSSAFGRDRGMLARSANRRHIDVTKDHGSNILNHMPQIIMSENLMLQRLVTATKDDPGDDHWEITGQITEFFDENRLVLLSAKRAGE